MTEKLLSEALEFRVPGFTLTIGMKYQAILTIGPDLITTDFVVFFIKEAPLEVRIDGVSLGIIGID